jgi:hypothetical protein
LANDVVSNLQMIGGTVTLGTNFQGGVITTLTLGSLLAGSYTEGTSREAWSKRQFTNP